MDGLQVLISSSLVKKTDQPVEIGIVSLTLKYFGQILKTYKTLLDLFLTYFPSIFKIDPKEVKENFIGFQYPIIF